MKVYIASPFFTEEELQNVYMTEEILSRRGFEVLSPRFYMDDSLPYGSEKWATSIFKQDVKAINKSDFVVALYYGMYSDSGTAWEIGYCYGIHKPLLVVCIAGGMDLNLMEIIGNTDCIVTADELNYYVFEKLWQKRPGKTYMPILAH